MASAKACRQCEIRDKCTRSKSGRTLKRHERQDELDGIVERAQSKESKKDLKTRQHLSERYFARSTRYGFKRARWRNQWRMRIQDYLIAAIQNITVLINQPINKMAKRNTQESRKGRSNGLIEQIKRFYNQLIPHVYPGFLIIRLNR